MQQQHPDKQVEVWAEDEGRMGLKPITRRHWAPLGSVRLHPTAQLSVVTYLCVCSSTFWESAFWLASHVDIPTMQAVLDAFVATVNPEGKKTHPVAAR